MGKNVFVWIVLALFYSNPAAAQVKKSVFVVTDAEGVAGIFRQEQVEPKNSELRELLTGEVNAAVEGFWAGGAEEVTVWDGHAGSETLSLTTTHPRAKLLVGWMGLSMTLDRHYSAVAFIGQHSMANTRKGIMAHSYSSLGIQNMLLNGKPIGEIGMICTLAGYFGTAVILLTGDQAAVDEMKSYVPQAETVAVKEGLGRYAGISLSASASRQAIREAAERAMAKIGKVSPYKVEGVVTLQIENTTRNSLSPDAGLAPGIVVLDDRTVRIQGKDFLEAWTRWRVYR